MSKKLISICLLTFLIGCAGGGALAYANHQKGLEEQSLLASLSQTQDSWEVEQFIRVQEEQRPDGLEESQIVTGSKYTGITYNNVSVATVHSDITDTAKMNNKQQNDETVSIASHDVKTLGRVAIQSGSLNIRAAASIDGTVIGQAYKDEQVEIIGQDGVWYHIVTSGGQEGYVSSTYIEIIEE